MAVKSYIDVCDVNYYLMLSKICIIICVCSFFERCWQMSVVASRVVLLLHSNFISG